MAKIGHKARKLWMVKELGVGVSNQIIQNGGCLSLSNITNLLPWHPYTPSDFTGFLVDSLVVVNGD